MVCGRGVSLVACVGGLLPLGEGVALCGLGGVGLCGLCALVVCGVCGGAKWQKGGGGGKVKRGGSHKEGATVGKLLEGARGGA